MKKTSKIILFVLVVVALLCGVYRLANKAPSASLESNAQMAEIIESSVQAAKRFVIVTQNVLWLFSFC